MIVCQIPVCVILMNGYNQTDSLKLSVFFKPYMNQISFLPNVPAAHLSAFCIGWSRSGKCRVGKRRARIFRSLQDGAGSESVIRTGITAEKAYAARAERMKLMGEKILLVIVLLLSLYGCTELIRYAVLRILKPYRQYSGVLVLPIKGHHDDIEYLVRTVTTQSDWTADMTRSVLLVDEGMDKETREAAESICIQYNHVHFGKPEEIEKMITSDLH